MGEKKQIFVIFDEAVGGSVIMGDIDQTLEYIRTYLAEMQDREEQTFDVQRRDMTEEEIKALPVV